MKLMTLSLAVCVSALVGCAAKKPEPPPTPPPAAHAATSSGSVLSGKLDEQTVTATATVEKINQKTRHVTLKRSDGVEETIVAGPEVRNLKQVKKGDVVRITYHQSIAYDVKKAGAGKPGVSTSSNVSRAAPGERPGASVTDTVTVRMTITAIDKAASQASLRGPNGEVHVVKVKDPSKLDVVQVGDVVDLTYTEALALSVEKAGKK